MKVNSPCISVCVVHAGSGLCTGCKRTLDEIARWKGMDDAERDAIMAQLGAREIPAAPDLTPAITGGPKA